MAKRIFFRTEESTKTSAAEALDERIKLLPFRIWFALLPALIMLFTMAAWAFYGNINIETTGSGIITDLSGPKTITAKSTGTVKHIAAEKKQYVRRGQLLVMLNLQMTEIELKQCIDKFVLLEFQFSELLEGEKKSAGKINFSILKDLNAAANHLRTRSSLYKYMREKQNQEFYNDLIKSIGMTEKNLQSTISDDNEKILFEEYKPIWEKLQEIYLSENELYSKIHDYIDTVAIRSPVSGEISDIMKKDGDKILDGENILTITPETDNDSLLTAFIPADDAKDIKQGQIVHILPLNASPEKNGYIIGKIRHISQSTETHREFYESLKNRDTADFLKNGGELNLKVIVELQPDTGSYSGLLWTLKTPKNIKLSVGTLCRVSIISEKKSPAEYIFPWIKQNKKQVR